MNETKTHTHNMSTHRVHTANQYESDNQKEEENDRHVGKNMSH